MTGTKEDISVERLIEVSTEVTLALEALEDYTFDAVHTAMVDGVEFGMGTLDKAYTDLTPQQLKVVRACMAEGIHHACSYTLANILIHEQHLGMVSKETPGNCAVNACNHFRHEIVKLWEAVNS